ncbi:MAG: class I SAM-dependent methyltransferase [Dehalococcoidia bacterium]|nr:class I SAM-dependent methyltransferase [Dehalococcoidia bacterium]
MEACFHMGRTPEAEIRGRIASNGPITFAEFMEVALYHPNGGYYTQDRQDPAHRDYYTSPSAHPAFSALVAVQLEIMWKALDCPVPFHVVEMGAGSGLMAQDITDYVGQHLSPFAQSMHYFTVDKAGGETPRGVIGCVLSNELIDAFPVHRFEIADGRLVELFVDVDPDGKFRSVTGEPSTPALAQRLDRLGLELPNGTRGEINLRISESATRVSEIIERGFVVTIDYGHEAKELYSPERSRGTLQTYYKHTSGSSPYQWIGRQDITAHVDFTTVIDEGRNVGLEPLSLMTQAEYLNRLGLKVWADRLRDRDISPRDVRANATALRDLVDPDGLGGFKVLIQEKDTELEDVNRLFPSPACVEQLPMPLLRSDHVPLYEGGYSSDIWNFEVLPKDE